jgi:hypothetical protein
MRHLTRILFIGIIIMAALPSAAPAQQRWQSITDQEFGFSISFPGQPIYQLQTSPLINVPVENYTFIYNVHHLQISFWVLTDPPRTPAEVTVFLDNSIQVYGRNAGTLLGQEKLPDGGRQFDNIMTDAHGTLHLRSRIYLHRGKFFSLSYGTYASQGIDEQLAQQFFSSFRFSPTATGRRTPSMSKQSRSKVSSTTERVRWYTLRGVHGDFVVELPGKPSFKQTTEPGSGILLDQYIYFFGENTFMIAARDRYKDENSPEQIIRSMARMVVADFEGWRLREPVKLPDGNYEVEGQGLVNNEPMQLRLRLYVRVRRLFFISSFTKNFTGPNRDDVERFFASFRTL